ncbi:hypothetical protein MJN51_30925, partial [Salmonella enterica subsp. enterica serovar Kentucky]|nr:hypothetical protein [Salmonella enterica subsp. enterica serovar Kentucky]
AEKTLFIDDSEPILDAAARFGIRYCLGVTNPDSGLAEKHYTRLSAARFGIRYCLGVTNPDSGLAEKHYTRHPSLNDYRRLIPSLK